MAEDAGPAAVVSPVKLVADGSDYEGTFYVGDVDVFFVLVSGYLVRFPCRW